MVRLSDLQPGLTRLADLQPGLTRRDLQDLVSQVLIIAGSFYDNSNRHTVLKGREPKRSLFNAMFVLGQEDQSHSMVCSLK